MILRGFFSFEAGGWKEEVMIVIKNNYLNF